MPEEKRFCIEARSTLEGAEHRAVAPYSLESIHAREGFLFDPASQNLIAIRAVFAGIYDPGESVFAPR